MTALLPGAGSGLGPISGLLSGGGGAPSIPGPLGSLGALGGPIGGISGSVLDSALQGQAEGPSSAEATSGGGGSRFNQQISFGPPPGSGMFNILIIGVVALGGIFLLTRRMAA